MDYFAIIKKAFLLPWKHKYLIWLGILAGLGAGGGNNFSYSFNSTDWQNFFNEGNKETWLPTIKGITPRVLGASTDRVSEFIANNIYWLGLAVLILFLLLIFILIIRLMAEAGLIDATNKIEGGKESTFGDEMKIGYHYFWRLVAINILVFLVVLLVMAILITPVFLFFYFKLNVLAWIWLVLIIIVFIPAAIYVGFIVEFWKRYLIIGKEKIINSLNMGIHLVNKKIKEIIIIFLLILLASIVFMIVVGFVVLILALPFILIAVGLGLTVGWIAGIIAGAIGLLVLIVASLLLSGYFTAFTSSVWTFVYIELKNTESKIGTATPR